MQIIEVAVSGRQPRAVQFSGGMCRIGSGSRCQIQIAGLDPEAVAIFTTSGTVSLINKTDRRLKVGRRKLASGRTAVLSPGEWVHLPGVKLRLATEERATKGNSGPPRQQATRAASPDTGSSDSNSPADKRKTSRQIAVIAVCVVFCIGMLGIEQIASSNSPDVLAQLSAEIAAAQEGRPSNEFSDQTIMAELLRRIQQYRLAFTVGDPDHALCARSDALNICRSLQSNAVTDSQDIRLARRVQTVLQSDSRF